MTAWWVEACSVLNCTMMELYDYPIAMVLYHISFRVWQLKKQEYDMKLAMALNKF